MSNPLDKTLLQLPVASTPAGQDVVYTVQNTVSKKLSLDQIPLVGVFAGASTPEEARATLGLSTVLGTQDWINLKYPMVAWLASQSTPHMKTLDGWVGTFIDTSGLNMSQTTATFVGASATGSLPSTLAVLESIEIPCPPTATEFLLIVTVAAGSDGNLDINTGSGWQIIPIANSSISESVDQLYGVLETSGSTVKVRVTAATPADMIHGWSLSWR